MKTGKLSIAAAAMLVLTGCATQPVTLAASDAAVDASLMQCAQVTGSRIRNPERRQCESFGFPSRSFSADEIQSTGEMDLVEALRQLDPSFR